MIIPLSSEMEVPLVCTEIHLPRRDPMSPATPLPVKLQILRTAPFFENTPPPDQCVHPPICRGVNDAPGTAETENKHWNTAAVVK